jgi:chromosome partitioning protein
MKVVATINFKGGVGKTTVTWLLAQHIAERCGKKVLVVDADAQMSLTTAVGLDESGRYNQRFQEWYENRHKKVERTLLRAILEFERSGKEPSVRFDFPIDQNLIFEHEPNLHFIPSTEDLYWLELEVVRPEQVKSFANAFLGKLEHSKRNYDFVFFDCPPSFTALSYSVLSNCSLVLVPVNPDVFAAKGLTIMLDGLRERIEPWPEPKIAVFMNRARTFGERLTRETQTFLNAVEETVNDLHRRGMGVSLLKDCTVLDRADIRKSIARGRFPEEFRDDIDRLWRRIAEVLKAK